MYRMRLRLSLTLLLLGRVSAIAPPALPPHPRLIVDSSRLATIQADIASNSEAASLYSLLLQHADWLVQQPPTPYPAGANLILVRYMLDVVVTTALAYRLSGNASYLSRAEAEMLSVTNWSDWGPGSFLCVAETSAAIAIGYDWLYASLSDASRGAIEQAMVNKSLTLYASGFAAHSFFWYNDAMNWNCVCSGGGILASVAMADATHSNASSFVWSDVFTPSAESLPYCVGGYAGEGSWMEGYSYATYMGKYWIYAASALATAGLGNYTSALTAIPGASAAGRFFVHEQSSTGSIFNWADEEETPCVVIGANYSTMTPFVMWLGSTFNDSIAAFDARHGVLVADTPSTLLNFQWGGYAEGMMFFTPLGSEADYAALPLGHWYPDRQVVTFRTGWPFVEAPGAGSGNYLAVKGGNTGYTHSHADLGTFVYDSGFTRFVMDLGADNYGLPGYWGPQRYSYYRLSSLGHNMPSFSDGCQSTTAAASVVTANVTSLNNSGIPVDGFLVLNLNSAYSSAAAGVASVHRGVASLANVSSVLVTDEFTFSNASAVVNVTWRIHTAADVVLTSAVSAVLSRNGSSLPVTLLETESICAGAVMQVDAIALQPPQYPTTGDSRLSIVANAACTRIVVLLGSETLPGNVHVAPLDSWATQGPFASAA